MKTLIADDDDITRLRLAAALTRLGHVHEADNGFQHAAEPMRRLEASASSPIFSRETLLDELDGDEALLQRMVALFHSNTPLLLDGIRAATHRQHADDLARAAHALLSSLGAFGAKEAHRLTLRIEELARNSDFAQAGQAFSELECETARVCDAIQKLSWTAA